MSGKMVTTSQKSGSGKDVADFVRRKARKKQLVMLEIRSKEKEAVAIQKEVDALVSKGKEAEARMAFAKLRLCSRMIKNMKTNMQQLDIIEMELQIGKHNQDMSQLKQMSEKAYRDINNGMPESMMISQSRQLDMTRQRTLMSQEMVAENDKEFMDSMMEGTEEEESGGDGSGGSGFEEYMRMRMDETAQLASIQALSLSGPAADAVATATVKQKTARELFNDEWINSLKNS